MRLKRKERVTRTYNHDICKFFAALDVAPPQVLFDRVGEALKDRIGVEIQAFEMIEYTEQ